MYLSYIHQPPPTWPPDCCSEPSTVCKHTECVPQVRYYTDDPMSVSSHRQMGLCWQGSIVRGQRSWQRGDDVTAGCGPSNRQCSVGKIGLSARGHPAGHREGFDELISARWLPLIQLGLPGWRIERKNPEGLKNVTKPSEEFAEGTVMLSKTQGEGWLLYYWWLSKNARLWLRHNEFVRELNAQSRLREANTLCLFFTVCDCSDAQMFWHLCMVLKLPGLGAAWVRVRCCRSTPRHNPARNAQQLSLLTSFSRSATPLDSNREGLAVMHYVERLNGEEQCSALMWFD